MRKHKHRAFDYAGCGDGVHEDGEAECAERLPCSHWSPVHYSVSEFERIGEGHEEPGRHGEGSRHGQDDDRLKRQEPSGCVGQHQVQSEVCQSGELAEDRRAHGAVLEDEDITDGSDTGGENGGGDNGSGGNDDSPGELEG